MSNTHDRVASLARRFLDPVREPNFDASFSESAYHQWMPWRSQKL